MSKQLPKNGERVLPDRVESIVEHLSYLRHLFAYEHASQFVNTQTRLLDVGCGEGYGVSQLSKTCNAACGVDVSDHAIMFARSKYQCKNLKFRTYDGITIPYKDNAFNLVVSFQVIEHVKEVNRYLQEIKRVLRSDGMAIITTPCRLYRLKPGQKPWNPYHIIEYDPKGFLQVLESVFADVEVKGIRAADEVQAIEYERVKKGLSRKDPYNLRRFIPTTIRSILRRSYRRIRSKGNEEMQLTKSYTQFSTSDFYIIEDGLEQSIDLLGTCRNSSKE